MFLVPQPGQISNLSYVTYILGHAVITTPWPTLFSDAEPSHPHYDPHTSIVTLNRDTPHITSRHLFDMLIVSLAINAQAQQQSLL